VRKRNGGRSIPGFAGVLKWQHIFGCILIVPLIDLANLVAGISARSGRKSLIK
jgi:hypothetical protein